ncbi:TetR/AcrR family transcriptional regulator [Pseudolysinimonas sp.]|uniref:TetR/AcrR family transcriptional regulator n=1 Tax=Pseudolysinimonas sp. TaxID=2680009 RepID=UPI003783BA77
MDPRIARTRQSLQQALFDLARERGLDEISVADIAERAGVNRSSFYQHYADKDTLLADAIDAVAEVAGADLPVFREITPEPPPILIGYLKHIEENAAVYARVFGSHGSPVAVARLRSRVLAIASAAVATVEAPPLDDIPAEVRAAGLTGSVLGVLEAWLAQDPRPPVETAVSWMWRMLLGPVGAELADAATDPSTPAGRRAATS